MSLPTVSVVGAGPAGLAAAIALARHGARVIVHEQHPDVGGRFHGDFQGLENWTTEEDALSWLARLGISLSCPYRATGELTLVDPDLQPWRVRSDQPLLYLLKRGRDADSLDQCLRAQAEALGVEFRFGARVAPARLSGPVIVATGPQRAQAVVAGIVADTPYADQIVAIARNAVAPKGYAYCVIWRGRATVAAALGDHFHEAWPCFERARAAFAALGLVEFSHERRFGGRASISLALPLEADGRLYVGEAAGLQDYLLGFGLRYAMLSGYLAARALLTGRPYTSLIRRELLRSFRARFVNRLIYNRLGDRGYGRFIRWVAGAKDVPLHGLPFRHRFHNAL